MQFTFIIRAWADMQSCLKGSCSLLDPAFGFCKFPYPPSPFLFADKSYDATFEMPAKSIYNTVPSIHSVLSGNTLDLADSSFNVLVDVTHILILFLILQSIVRFIIAVFTLPPLGDDTA